MKTYNKERDLIYNLYKTNKVAQAKREIKFLVNRYKKLDDETKTFTFAMLINLKLEDECFKFYEATLDFQELLKANESVLKRQIYLLNLRHTYGSFDLSINYIKMILAVLDQRKNFNSNARKQIYNSAANLLLNSSQKCDIEIVKNLESNSNLDLKSNDIVDYFLKISFFASTLYLKNNISQNDLIKYNQFFKNPTPNEVLSFVIKIDRFGLLYTFDSFTKLEFERMKEELPLTINYPVGHTWHVIYYAYGEYHFGDKNIAINLIIDKLKFATTIFERTFLIFWLSIYDLKSIIFEDLVFLKMSPYPHYLNFLAGNNLKIDHEFIPKVYRKYIPEVTSEHLYECWLISYNKIRTIKYFNFRTIDNCIDLCSGIIFKNNSLNLILTKKRIHLLRLLIGSGSQGAHISFLIDQLFEGEYLFFESAKLRIKNLLTELKRIGISIKRKKNIYYFDFTKNSFEIIFPKNHHFYGPSIFIAKNFSNTFSALDLIKTLNIKSTTASKYLKHWQENKIIVPTIGRKRGYYKFIEYR